VNSPLPAKPGKIELDLEEKDTRILGPFFVGITFVFALALCPIFGATASWLPSLACLAVCGAFFYPLYRLVRPLIGTSLVLDSTGIELMKKGERDFRSSWSAISHVHVVQMGFRPKTLRLLDLHDKLLGEIPLGQSPVRFHELIGLIAKHLPPSVQINRLVKGTKGTLGGRILLAAGLTAAGIGSLFVAFQAMSAVAGSLRQQSGTWLLFFGIVALPCALMQWSKILAWRMRIPADHFEPVSPLFAHSALPDLRHLLAGLPVGRKARYVYSPEIVEKTRNFKPSAERASALFGGVVLAAMVLLSLWGMTPNVSLAILIPLMVLSGALSLALPFLLTRKLNRHQAELRGGVGDELMVEHRALWVLRGERKIPARVLSEPTYQMPYEATTGLNRMRIPVEVGEETIWYDPTCMFDEEGLALLEQSKTRVPP